jgi:hypothetical protein
VKKFGLIALAIIIAAFLRALVMAALGITFPSGLAGIGYDMVPMFFGATVAVIYLS